MIVTIVRMPNAAALTLEQATAAFLNGAASYLDVDGLIFKAYLRSEDAETVGGVYWWRDREAADAKFNPAWFEGVSAKYGAAPEVEFFDAPVVVDTVAQAVRTEPPTL